MENLEFIHPAEIEICNKLAHLGSNYVKINEFVENFSFGKYATNTLLKRMYYSFKSSINLKTTSDLGELYERKSFLIKVFISTIKHVISFISNIVTC